LGICQRWLGSWRSERPAASEKDVTAGELSMIRSIITSDRFAGLEIVALALLVGVAIAVAGVFFASIVPQI
jgi:hypothetical protein